MYTNTTEMKNSLKRLLTVIVVASLWSEKCETAGADEFVTEVGTFDADGSVERPFGSIGAGLCALDSGGAVLVGPGVYGETFSSSQAGTMMSTGGVVRIGDLGTTQTMLKVVTFNTHLFGDAVPNLEPPFPPIPLALYWLDEARAALIGSAAALEDADLFAMQEVWDPDRGNDILGNANYPFFSYGGNVDPESYDPPGPVGPLSVPGVMNSGLLTLSKHNLVDAGQFSYNAESEFFETLATKGYLRATIQKDGISIGVFNTHMQAHNDPDQVQARAAQLAQLSNAIVAYRSQNPSHAVIAVGDFNVISESFEYMSTMSSQMGGVAGTLDLVRNMPCVSPGPAHYTSLHDNALGIYFTDCAEPAYTLCSDACTIPGETCDTLCGPAQTACVLGCQGAHGACVGGCTAGCLTTSIVTQCLAQLPGCAIECCFGGECNDSCLEDCFDGCNVFDTCVDTCEGACLSQLGDCDEACALDCTDCLACEEACQTQFCVSPDASEDARLDYIAYVGSLDGSVDIAPINYALRGYQSPSPLSFDGLTTTELSDHVGVMAEFRLVKR